VLVANDDLSAANGDTFTIRKTNYKDRDPRTLLATSEP